MFILRKITITVDISIHALLAESDPAKIHKHTEQKLVFLSTLSLRRATSQQPDETTRTTYFYPRSPCGERLRQRLIELRKLRFLSTLSLRRATYTRTQSTSLSLFLSTLSLRRATRRSVKLFRQNYISIHALLAESDCF